MNINPTHIKYIEWRNPDGLHEDTMGCISQLEFFNDELDFLSHLIKEYTFELTRGEVFKESKAIVGRLIAQQIELQPLIAQLQIHRNNLQLLMDDVDVSNEVKDYKTEHYELMTKAIGYNTRFKKLKKETFKLISNVMKLNKQKRLLN